MTLPEHPAVRGLACLLVTSLVSFAVHAQNTEGMAVQETPGIALVKPHSWSKESDATVLEFEAFVDRRAISNAAAGYYEFHLPSGNRRQVASSKVVRVVLFPDEAQIVSLVEPADRDRIAASIKEMTDFVTHFPAARSHLQPHLQEIAAVVQRYDAGEVKLDGQWIPRRVYLESQAEKFDQVLREEIQAAKPPGSFNLAEDLRFASLRNMGAALPKARALAAELAALNQRLARETERDDILKRLQAADATYEASGPLIERLGALQPTEDPAAAAFLQKWKAATSALAAIEPIAGSAAAVLESELANFHAKTQAPEFSTEARAQFKKLADQLRSYRRGDPPAAFDSRVAGFEAVAAVGAGFMALDQPLLEKRLFEAKTTVDAIAPQARTIGPQCSRVIEEFQKAFATRIEIFTRARDEARSLAEGGKPQEAIARYEEALEIIADPSVESALAALKAAPPQP